jgi:hypothetical protein
MNREAFAGHAGEADMSSLASLMPHELGMLIAGLTVMMLALGVLLFLALRRLSRLERRVSLLEHPRTGLKPIPPEL